MKKGWKVGMIFFSTIIQLLNAAPIKKKFKNLIKILRKNIFEEKWIFFGFLQFHRQSKGELLQEFSSHPEFGEHGQGF